ncbi:bacillithiol biosynthesis deacetylase BshB1 [Sporocytophaga myxococcoides]|nr:bacillithiol biosynthesis deacetylase BshB1 [Sporocytophaga myxococcoides]
MKLDMLVLSAHPDDAELACSGTIISHIEMGKKVGLVDLTRGQLGTRGTPEIREMEAEAAASILGLAARENLGFEDGFFVEDKDHIIAIVKAIRKYQPEIIITNALHDRHPDHGRASDLVSRASFLSGLIKIETGQKAWRPRNVYHYIQDRYIKPDLIVDVTPYWDQKIKTIKAFRSQFFNPDSEEPGTYISSPEFLLFIEARALELGHSIGVKYGEGFTSERNIGIKNMFELL